MGYISLDRVNKFGRGPSSTGGLPVMPAAMQAGFRPAAAATTTVESASLNDTLLGTGARTVTLEGVNGLGYYTVETCDMDGTTPVTCATQFLRVFRAYVASAGTGEVNAGIISVKHGATVIASMNAGEGQSLISSFYVPDGHTARINRLRGDVETTGNVHVTFKLWVVRNGVQRLRWVFGVDSGGSSTTNIDFGNQGLGPFDEHSDMWIEGTASTGTPIVTATFDMQLQGQGQIINR